MYCDVTHANSDKNRKIFQTGRVVGIPGFEEDFCIRICAGFDSCQQDVSGALASALIFSCSELQILVLR